MTDKLPQQLLQLFAPRPPLRYLPPQDTAPEHRHTPKITPVGQYLEALQDYKANDTSARTESDIQRRDRLKREKKDKHERQLTEGLANFKPAEDPNIKGDAFKTLFVSRLDWNIEPRDLEKEFGRYGPIERIRIIRNTAAPEDAQLKKKSKGYAFIVYERERDMKAAYKETDGIRIRDRRVKVDCERGRTVKDWKPRRFGGGIGGRGYTKIVAKPTGFAFGSAPMAPGGRGGGFRGGFGGRFEGPRGGGFRGGPRGGGFGGRGGIGYQGGGFGGAPEGAPAGPRGPRGPPNGGFGGRDYDRPNGYGGGGYGDRDRQMSGSNMEPVRSSRDRFDDRDRQGGGRDDYYSRKRRHDEEYDDPRKRRY